MKKILILGADGYLGWSLVKKLSRENHEIIAVDNGLRRRLVKGVNSDSLTPIASMGERIKTLGGKVTYFDADITEAWKIEEIIKAHSPSVIINCAQQASAPYSMLNREQAVETLLNNEVGNMNILWSIKNYCPNALYLKLGSFGEYASTNIEVAEGYFKPTYKGVQSLVDIPFPRCSGDFYHASKANDSNYLAVAARCWNLRIVELMQSTIFGCEIDLEPEDEKLVTRFDYDQYFGTVVNRFIIQTLLGIKHTIYGSGKHRTGIMSLEQAVSEISHIVKREYEYQAGHTVFNNSPSVDFTINELSELISRAATDLSISIVDPNTATTPNLDPRKEWVEHQEQRSIATSTLIKVENSEQFYEYVRRQIIFLDKYKHNCKKETINPTYNWHVKL